MIIIIPGAALFTKSGCQSGHFGKAPIGYMSITMCFYTKTEYEEDEKVTDVDRKPDPSSRPCSYIVQ